MRQSKKSNGQSKPRTAKSKRKGGRPENIPVEDAELVRELHGIDLSWVPDELREKDNRIALRQMLRVWLACKTTHKGVNDIDQMQIAELGRLYAQAQHEFASSRVADTETARYRCLARYQKSMWSVRAILRDLKLLRSGGLKVRSTTPSDNSEWKGLL